jgi:hypothetical protein
MAQHKNPTEDQPQGEQSGFPAEIEDTAGRLIMKSAVKHPELAEIAKLLSEDPETCQHLAEACPDCHERLQQVKALMKRFQHWDPEVAVLEGLRADDLLATILAAGPDSTSWIAQLEKNVELVTWGVAWAALEQAREQMDEEASRPRARDLALLAEKIAERLGNAYHEESVADLQARAYATAAAATPSSPDHISIRLEAMGEALAALDEGTGDEEVAVDVWRLLSKCIRHGDGDVAVVSEIQVNG